ncbi:paired amphipathic helix protein Sin3a [Parasteatoda tepidariorum]|uniref:paired amphipathic helix protein Sin3a n=1 Tax=Parasteatoda tepidariorum TaxID=114398 RepID=UPI00077FD155|nr:paired amphipathic helix protein Sin3a [Parasteatoda tepidariorum]XP_015903336.1 paired amphipathic helix protein Sin3a [Parasteatoda tepidariorum]XP_042907046.1 paired amphipathic helix protein Sin3a [Parasteatoda tepidariorum]
MRRHLDDHNPNVSSNNSVFSSLSASTSSPRSFSELDIRPGILGHNNIPSTPPTTTFHHSSSPRGVNKPLISRQPLALIQETVHAVGTSSASEMQSGVQFSLPSGYQARVAAATTLSQGNLGQPPAVHHSLPIQAQAHTNTQIVHPIQSNSQAHVTTQMQGHQMQFQRLKVEDALSYLDQVKYKFGNQPQVYNDFLDIMKEFKSQSIDTPGVIQRVSNLFRGHPELIVGFNTFLPPGYRIEVQPNEQVQVSIPGTSMGAAVTSLTIHPTGPPSTTVVQQHPTTHSTQTNHNSPPPPPTITVNKASHPLPVVNNQSHSNSQNQHVFNQSSPAHSQPSPAGSPNNNNNNTATAPPQQQQSQPVEFNHAINYVNKIKNRFQGQPDIYKQFLEILHTYQKEQRNIKDGQLSSVKPLTEGEVYSQVANLFKNQEDLLQEFGQFLPDANGAANAFVGLPPVKSLSNNDSSVVKKPSLPLKPPLNNQPKPVQVVKRPAPQLPSPPIKKSRMTSLKDVSMAEANKFTSLTEYAFFDKVRKALKSQDVYDNFLRCLIIYNQELISRTDLVLVVTPFLSKYNELFKWFKDFVGYKESNTLDIVPKKLEKEERVVGEFATEIDYSSCIKYGASYRAVPRNYVQPKCSGRTGLCREVLNDTWVSFPSWSEDSTFVSSRKTQFEEYIYRCEDERFELDVVIETNLSTIRYLESEVMKMNRMSAEEKARYRLDDTLGGSSNVIQQRAIRRIYGDKSADIIEGLKKNPVNSVPLVLRRLKSKDEEWRKSQKLFNKTWREQNEKYYLKSLDHQGINFKQNDVKFLRSKSILNEIETIYEERHEQADESMIDIPAGPHLVLTYKNRDIFKDAANLIIHHVKRQTGIHKEDKTKIKQLMRQFFPDFFSVPRGDLSDDEVDKDEDMETEDGSESPACKNLWSLSMACSRNSAPLTSKTKPSPPPPQPAPEDSSVDGSSLPDESYNLMFVNNNWYIFFRLHHILCERLWKLHERAQMLISDELKDQEERKQSTALALRLKPRQNLDVEFCFSSFMDMVKNLLDNNLESNQYEDNLREMFGIQAYLGFTLDKVIQNVVRQLQHIVGDESCTQWTTLYLEEIKNKATGGSCATASQRVAAELAYQKKAEQMSDENLFKLLMYKEEGKLTIELLDTDSDVSEDAAGSNKWITFVRKFCEESMVNSVKDHIKKNPPFLFRIITAYMNRKKLQKEKECGDREQENALRSIQEVIDDSKIDLSRLEDGGAGEAVKGLVGLNAKAKFLERTRLNKMNSESTSVCRFNLNSFKMLWVVDCEDNNICQPHCLAKALKSHRRVSNKLNRRFRSWHQSWLDVNVSEEQSKKCKNWLLGMVEDSVPTTCIHIDNPSKPPYSPYNRYKPQQKDKT